MKKVVVVVLTMMFGLVAMTGKVDAAKKVAPVQTIKTTKVNQAQDMGSAAMTLKDVQVQKINKKSWKTMTDAEGNSPQIKAPYYRVTYHVQFKSEVAYKADLSNDSWTVTLADGVARTFQADTNDENFYSTLYEGVLHPNGTKNGSFVIMTKDKNIQTLPITINFDGFTDVDTNSDNYSEPVEFKFNK